MNQESWIEFVWERRQELMFHIGQHVRLFGTAVGAAILIGVPLGILIYKKNWLKGPVLGIAGTLQTIPSIAMLVLLLKLFGMIGFPTAVTALILYALLPIVRNTATGLEGVPPEINEAAKGLGMSEGQRMRIVRLPLALPVIMAGIRTAAVISVGIATLSALIGAGGLGQPILRGLSLGKLRLSIMGAVPAVILALIVDGSFSAAEWGLKPFRKSRSKLPVFFGKSLKVTAIIAPLLVFTAGLTLLQVGQKKVPAGQTAEGLVKPKDTIVIGSKDFTEQFILCELMAQVIEAKTDIAVKRRKNLAGTMICHGALTSEDIHIYAEYTGTALLAILEEEVLSNPDAAYKHVKKRYKRKFNLIWLEPFGFNNTYALTVRQKDAKKNSWETISDIKKVDHKLSAGFTSEFAERPDGYPGLKKTYGLEFKDTRDLQPTLMYNAIKRKEVDVICAFATDGRIAEYNLEPLKDNKNFFPPYYAAPVIRADTLKKYPEIGKALKLLAGKLDDQTMQKLNYEVDGNKKDPSVVARNFLVKNDIISK